MRISSGAVLIGWAVTIFAAQPARTQTPVPAPRSTCRGPGCAGLRHGQLYLATFGTLTNSPGLRTSNVGLEQEPRIMLAFYGIDATNLEVEAGRKTRAEADAIIETFESTIRYYTVGGPAAEALALAKTGDVAMISSINARLGVVLSVARQDALLGREALADEAFKMLDSVLLTFSTKFAETCDQQVYSPEVALAIERQNLLLTSRVSVMHCARRLYAVDISRQRVTYHLESCAMDGSGEWNLTISGKVTGNGNAGEPMWNGKVQYQGRPYEPTGDFEVVSEPVVVEESRPVVPNDAGPNARPNGLPQAPVPRPYRPPVRSITKVRMTTIELAGDHGIDGWTSGTQRWGEGVIAASNQPCKKPK